ncbi:MAG: O-antigen ligase domain-containing protein [Flavobacteriales bacterium]|nr:MAG: O-antigen ligase domain-containing protein [Flavobacteriales bacterium]
MFVLCLFAVGIVCSKFLMSMSILLGLLNLIVEGDFKQYFQNLKQNKFFLLVLLFFLIHVLAMAWSDNWDYGLNDLRRKLSLLAVPIIIISKPIQIRTNYKIILSCFVAALIITSSINAFAYFYFQDSFVYKDIRDMSLFNSHIRYAIMISFGIPILLEINDSRKELYLIIPAIGWLLLYTYLSQVLTGLISLFTILIAYILYKLIVDRKIKSLFFLILTFCIGIGFSFSLLLSEPERNDNSKANLISMKTEWEKKSNFSFEGKDKRDQELKYTLARFLESKDLTKDAKGVQSLTGEEIKAVENGMADVSEMKIGFWGRLEGLRYQINHSTNPNGHSLLQRLEAWKTGIEIYKDYPFLGVGTGDVDDAYKRKYRENNSQLIPKNQIRAHNTYLTSLITFGVIGLLLFVFIVLYHLKLQIQHKQLLGFIFMILMLVTFFFEDTLETQTGITLFSFFTALYSIQLPSKKND